MSYVCTLEARRFGIHPEKQNVGKCIQKRLISLAE